MKVSFKGLANVGGYTTGGLSPDTITDKLVFQVNNNGENKDLDNFKEILASFPDPYNKNFVNLEFRTLSNGNSGIYVNSRPLHKFSPKAIEYKSIDPAVEEKKWDFIKKISDVIERVKKGDEYFMLHHKYTDSEDCKDRMDEDILKYSDPNYENTIKNAYNPQNLKIQGKRMSRNLKNNIESFLFDNKKFSQQVESISGFSIVTPNEDKFIKIMMKLPSEAIDKFGPRYNDYRSNNTSVMRVSIQQLDREEPKIIINQFSVPVDDSNKKMLVAISEKLKEIANDKDTLALPYQFKTIKHLRVLYESFDLDRIIPATFMSEEEKEVRGIDLKLFDNSSDLKDLAKTISKMIDKELDKK